MAVHIRRIGAMPLSIASLASLATLLAASPMARAGGDWLPLHVDNQWEYVDTSGGHHLEVITGTKTVRGREAFVRTQVGGTNSGLENYWQVDGDGSVLLAGFTNATAGLALAYEPPLKVLASSPALGLTWSTHSIAYNLSDGSVYATLDLSWSVLEDSQLDVPAGTFQAFGVGQVTPFPGVRAAAALPSGLSLDGRRATAARAAAGSGATDWYARGDGVVQYIADSQYQLVSASGPTPAATASWGRVKRLYR